MVDSQRTNLAIGSAFAGGKRFIQGSKAGFTEFGHGPEQAGIRFILGDHLPMNAHDRAKFTYTSYIAASPEKVWEALTSAAFTEQYWAGRHIVSTWKPGASVQMLKADGNVDWEGEVIKAAPPRVLAYTFLAPRVEPGATEPPSRVTIELEQQPAAVCLSLTHDGFSPPGKTYDCITQGWPAILSSLKSLVETGKAIEFPAWKER